MRAVVTGGAGFIGSHAAEALLARGDEVHVLDSLATGRREKVPDAATFHEGDIRTDAPALFDEVRPEVCFHLAAQADVGTSVERPDYDADVNVVGMVRMLEAARAHGTQLVFSSTGGALYGECDRPATEDMPRNPLSPYGMSKLCGEEYIAGWNRLHGTRHMTLRFANVFGPRQEPSLEGGVIAIFLERMEKGEPTQIFGDGRQTRDFIYVADVVAAMLAAAGQEPSVYNVATGVSSSVLEVHDACRRVTGSDREPDFQPPRPGDLLFSRLDPTRANEKLGWRAEDDLESGLRKTWEWMQAGLDERRAP